MSTCNARVIELMGGNAVVELEPRRHACDHCPKPGGCYSGLDAFASEGRRLTLPNIIDARPGDSVGVTVGDGVVWHASLFSYLVPVLLGISGAAAGQRWGDAVAIGGLVLGLVAGFFLLNRLGRRLRAGYAALRLSRQTEGVSCKE